MRADMLPLADIKRLPRNAKLHDLEKIHQSIERFGFLERVVINETTGHMIAGHGRCEDLEARKAAREEPPEGIEKNGTDWLVPVDYVSVLPGEENAAAIALNRLTETGGWETGALAELLSEIAASDDDDPFRGIGYDAADLDAMLAELTSPIIPDAPEPQIDRADELREQWQTETGQIWLCGRHRVMCGDSTKVEDVERLLDGAHADLNLFTDPPYGLSLDLSWLSALNISRGKPANKSDKKLSGDDGSLDLSFLWEFNRRFVWGFPYIFDPEATGWIVWDKQPGIEERGITAPVEMASTTFRKGFDVIRCLWSGYYRSKGEERHAHPTQKPVKVFSHFILSYTQAGDAIYDPFLGSGTTLIACEQLGRIGYGMEISPPFVAVVLERFKAMGITPESS